MLNKKNIAKTMAAATVISAAAPMTQVLAAERAVINNDQTQEIKALKEKVYELLNARYTENKNLLSNASLAGQRVYDEVKIIVPGMELKCTNYNEFITKFEKAFSSMKNGETIKVEYASNHGVRQLEDGQYVDSTNKTYTLKTLKELGIENEADYDKKLEIEKQIALKVMDKDQDWNAKWNIVDGLSPNHYVSSQFPNGIREYKIDVMDKQLSGGYNADGTTYVNVPTSEGYIKVVNGSDKLNFTKPKFKVVDGYYVNAKGEHIKKYIASEELVDPNTLTRENEFITELQKLGGVIEGYYAELNENEADKDSDVIAIVKKLESTKKEDLTVGDLYEISTGRLTMRGNETFKAMRSMIEDDYLELADGTPAKREDNLRATLYTINEAGEVVDTLSTYKFFENSEIDPRSRVTAEQIGYMLSHRIEEMLSVKEVVKFKVIVEQTTDEKATNPAAEWVPVYEANVTEGRNEKFGDLVVAFKGLNKMPIAAGLNRYETAVETSRAGWLSGSNEVVLVSGDSNKIVDGLTATPLASILNYGCGAPVLLTKVNEIPKETINEIVRLGAKKVTIVGGVNSVSDKVVKELKEVYGLEVERLGGDSRYETSMAVANKIAGTVAQQNSKKLERVFVVGGNGEADALSASAIAGTFVENGTSERIRTVSPILLTPQNKLDSEVKHFINKNVEDTNNEPDVFIVGGVNSVSNEVQTELVNIDVINDLGNKIEVKRLAGANRQDTNAAVINEFASELPNGVVIAKSDNKGMVDALAAGALAAKEGSHIVLSSGDLSEKQEDALDKTIFVLGATHDLPKKVDTKIQVGYGVAKSVIEFINSKFIR